MSDQVELTDPVDHSVGGMYGHLFRRVFHLAMSFIPLVYYEFGGKIADYLSIEVMQMVSAITLLIVFSEARQVSALAWGGFAVGMTFLTLPDSPELVWPLILSLSLGDPFLGEIRRKGFEPKPVFVYGTIFLMMVWMACYIQLGTPLWLVFVMAPLCVAAEWPRLRWIDDNATMLLIPLSAVIILAPWL